MSSILVAGSANLDFVVRAASIPAPGQTVLGRDFQTFPGGKGANQAVACARAGGVPTQMLLALGNDAFAPTIEDSLRQAGVHLHIVRASDAATGTAFICVADDAQNAITVAPGANSALRAEHLPALDTVSHLLLQLETPIETVTAYAQAARKAGVTVVLNAAPARTLPLALLEAIDVLIVNQGELAAITAADVSSRAALEQALCAPGVLNVPCIIVTLGASGCLVCHQQVQTQTRALFSAPGFAVSAVDTTAAGDTFCGALVAALHRGDPLLAALRRANAAAAIACTRLGAQPSIPQRAEVDAFLAARAEVR